MEDMKDWVGRQTSAVQVVEQWPLTGLDSLIGEQSECRAVDAAGVIHPCAHWLYFVPAVPQSNIDIDGHPKRGDFIPPLPQARRMWAKSEITYHADMRVGDRIEKVATISSLEKKSGKSGDLISTTSICAMATWQGKKSRLLFTAIISLMTTAYSPQRQRSRLSGRFL